MALALLFQFLLQLHIQLPGKNFRERSCLGQCQSEVHFLCFVCSSSRGCAKVFRHICKTVKWLFLLKDSLACYKSILTYGCYLYFIINVFTVELAHEESMAKSLTFSFKPSIVTVGSIVHFWKKKQNNKFYIKKRFWMGERK